MAHSTFVPSERFLDATSEPQRRLSPIQGYELKSLVSLKEAVRPFEPLIPNIQGFVWTATGNCERPKDGLTPDESAAVYLYTMECLYRQLNTALRSEDRQQLVPYFSYLKLFFTALWKLKDIQGLVFRGVKANISDDYPKGKKFPWWGLSSTTTSLDVLQKDTFLGESGPRTLFNIQCFNGKMIQNHSHFISESEVLLLPCSYFEVMGNMKQGADLRIIHLKQIEPPVVLIQPPFPSIMHHKESTSKPVQTKKNKFQQFGITVAGGNGKGNQLNQLNQLDYSHGIFIDDDKSIYIADTENHRIVKWKLNSNEGQIIVGGNKNDRLAFPSNIIFDKENNSFIISDKTYTFIKAFASVTYQITRYFGENLTNKQIIISNIACSGVAIDKNGSIYVSDFVNNEVRRWKQGDTKGELVAGGNGDGNHLNQLDGSSYIFVDKDCSLYISDVHNHRVMKWKKDAKEGIIVAGGNGRGGSLKQLYYPRGVIVDHLGQIYVADEGNHRVMRWCDGDAEGEVVVGGNGDGNESNQLNDPTVLSFDNEENLYVVDKRNHRIQKFQKLMNV
ncbi:unnamed protein product [Adineta steineri]|uniref:NAD(P)(+)--arginine ADP-ribosyltransferase n=1 Tax=Adineta steineri TaxID=433720 RepID=A0A815DYQ1_9BILA|nr:unnamed protein product [Adineta steineri]CAF1303340.1 unnamed protein product [Adineta steineri]CAF1304385.1 unnamed protein product [Adineta steineri]